MVGRIPSKEGSPANKGKQKQKGAGQGRNASQAGIWHLFPQSEGDGGKDSAIGIRGLCAATHQSANLVVMSNQRRAIKKRR